MRILISGSHGLVGSALVPFLSAAGHTVGRLSRPEQWAAAGFEGADAVIHLAGESIASGRWTAERKRRIRASRVEGTEKLAGLLAGLSRPPRTLLCASAVGYY